jgi:acid-sensing ion channel, other
MTMMFPEGEKSLGSVSSADYPLKSSSRHGQGLEIALSRNPVIDHRKGCTSPSFLVHSPYELPGSYDLIDLIQFGHGFQFDVSIIPEIIKTDADLKSLSPEKRGCYFQGEMKLKYFKVYTKRNCEFECFSKHLFQSRYLNCTPFYMVRTDSMDYCDYRNELELRETNYLIFSDNRYCICLKECDSVNYNIEIVAHNLEKSNHSWYGDLNYFNSTFKFRFKDVDVVPLRRYLSFTFSDFLAQSGGMMGLFAGISVLSIIELFYFLSLRWMVNLWRWIVKRFKRSRV